MIIILPARLKSTRVPSKALLPIEGVPLIRRVVDEVLAYGFDAEVLVATDSHQIEDAVSGACPVVMTSPFHRNGTERCADVATQLAFVNQTVIVNIQPDQLGLPKSVVSGAIDQVQSYSWEVGTAGIFPLPDRALMDPHKVKVHVQGHAAKNFTRKAWTDHPAMICGLHIGIYVYTRQALLRWARASVDQQEEQNQLEQLRGTRLGLGFGVHHCSAIPGWRVIDSPADVKAPEPSYVSTNESLVEKTV